MGEGSQVERLWAGNDDVDEMEKHSDRYIPFSQQGQDEASIPSTAKIDHIDILEVGTGDHSGRILSMA